MSGVEMFRISRGRHTVGTLRKSDMTTHGDVLGRLRYEVAAMVGGTLARSILRGRVTQYSDGSYSVSPCNARGRSSLDERGNIITYWAIPYVYEPGLAS